MWALIADTPYHLYPAYGWVMFVAVFLWLVTIVFFIIYLFQLHVKLYMVPWPLVVSWARSPVWLQAGALLSVNGNDGTSRASINDGGWVGR